MAYRKGQSPLTFHVPTDWHRRFKSIAGAQGQHMRAVMMQLVTAWMDHHDNREQRQRLAAMRERSAADEDTSNGQEPGTEAR